MPHQIPLAYTVLITALLVSGCSGSSDSSLPEQGNVESADETATDNPDPVVPDPVVQNTIQVDFQITVPAYQSDALQVRLIWGETDITANWIGDEFWSVSADFPADTEHLLTTTFYDDNGDLVLASYENTFKTGSNSSEVYRITADQFDTDQWDSDGDGTSNLAESIAQTDPLVDEMALLDVVDSVSISTRMTVSANFESRLSEERPFTESIKDFLPVPEEGPLSGYERNVDIYIDSSGNGAFYDFYQQDRGGYFTLYEHTGNRTNSGNSITWDGNWRFKDDALTGTTTLINFVSEVSVVDETTRSFVESISSYRSEFYFESIQIDSNLIGSVIEQSSLCKPVSGTVKITHSTNDTSNGGVETHTTVVSKETDKPYWRVSVVVNDDESTRSEYFARTLTTLPFQVGALENSGADFVCDFVDW